MRHLLMSLFLLLSFSCSVIEYAPKSSENEKGYWSKRIQKGIHKVYANYDRSSSPKRAMGYLVIRGFEICKKQNRKYVSLGIVTDNKEFENRTRSGNIYCRTRPTKFDLGAKLSGNTTRVKKVYKKAAKVLQPGDVILSINNKRVANSNDVDIVMYNMKSLKRNMKVLVERNGRKRTLRFKPTLRKDAFSQDDVVQIANRWNVPLTSINGIKL